MIRFYKKLVKRVLLSLLAILFSLINYAATYYISNAGNDSNSGLTTDQSWKTLEKVNSKTFIPGDNILFKRGDTFYGSITVKKSGNSGHPITFSAYGTGDNPVITGFTTVSSWTNVGGNIWESTSAVSLLSSIGVVTVNGVNTTMGRYPNTNATNSGYLMYQTSTKTSITSSDLTGTPNWTGAEVVERTKNYWYQKRIISSQSGGTINYTTTISSQTNNQGFFIQNDIRTLDQQNEWYYNPSTKKISIYSTLQPSNVKVSTVDDLLSIGHAVHDINIVGIDFIGANSHAIYRWPFGSAAQRAYRISVSNCNVTFSKIGIAIRGKYITIDNNYVSDINGNGITVAYNNHCTVTNNIVNNIGLLHGMPDDYEANSGIDVNHIEDAMIEYNRITNVRYDGINFSGQTTDSLTIKNNFIDNYCVLLGDGGGIYGSYHSHAKIIGNIVLNGVGPKVGTGQSFNTAVGIYLDSNTDYCEVSGNTVYNASCYGFQMNTVRYINTHDNTVYACGRNELKIQRWSGQLALVGNDFINNKFISVSSKFPVAEFVSFENDISSFFGTINNNYYARPLADNTNIHTSQAKGNASLTLADWKKFSGQEASSQTSSKTITDVTDIQFYYNDSKVDKVVALEQPMLDVTGKKYAKSITLLPFTSVVLMKDYSVKAVLFNEYKSICEGTNYNGWSTTGKYERKLISASGGDSIVTTYLTVNPKYSVHEDIILKEGETYQGWSKPGVYTRTLNSVSGCDSVVTTNLTVENLLNKQGEIAPSFDTGAIEVSSSDHVTGMKNKMDIMKIDVFPNPSDGQFTVRFSQIPDDGSKIDILDISGRKIISRLISENSELFSLAGQAAGTYLVKSIIGSNERIQKLVIN